MGDDVSGIVVVDKPEGISSAGVVAVVKRVFGARKAGHAGTLDPFATGVLVCCLDRATRLAGFFLSDAKAYRARLVLGTETDTQDATGNVTAAAEVPRFAPGVVEEAFARFKGEIEQAPPIYSALKHRGTPLYKLARRGTPVQKAARRVVVERIEIVAMRLPQIDFEVACSGGTYVRTLCADIGRVLGCGGHLNRLRRIASSGFVIDEAVALEELKAMAGSDGLRALTIPMADALRHLPGVVADAALVQKIRFGRPIGVEDVPGAPRLDHGGLLKLVDATGRLRAVVSRNRHGSRYDYRVNLQ